ncbi:MAG: hypothetical protein NC251_03850 [Lachnoclostridium sp.]|nr:hypothetical protein [Lachnospira sp.]MCM1247547.1 hypothetical protein [Lachnoclostridium sp.]
MKIVTKRWRDRLLNAAIVGLQLILLLIMGFLAYQGIRYSYFSSIDYGKYIFLIEDTTLKHLGVFALLCLAASFFLKLLEKIPQYQEKICLTVLGISCVCMAVEGFLYLRQHPYYPVGDQLNTTAGAAYARAGNFSMFQKGGYIGLYQQQKGFLFLYEILFSLFGDFCYDVAAWFHLGFGIVTLIAGYFFLKIVMKRPVYRILYCGCMVFCLPYLLYLPYIYGDLPSICFSMVLFWTLAAYERKPQKRYVAAAAAAGALALLVRMNVWIVLIAVAIGMLLLALKKGSYRPVLAGLCILLAAGGAVKAVDKVYEYRSGYHDVEGMPAILWIAMGLQETEGIPGVFNHYQQDVFGECGFDSKAAAETAGKDIAESLKEMRENPRYARDFFLTKVRMQWLEPLFESLYATNTFSDHKEIPDWVPKLYYGELHNLVWQFANYYQSIIYLACFAFVAAGIVNRKELPIGGWIPLIGVVGGFLFSIIWESQCRYVLPYYLFLLLYAPAGIVFVSDAALSLGKRMYQKLKNIIN